MVTYFVRKSKKCFLLYFYMYVYILLKSTPKLYYYKSLLQNENTCTLTSKFYYTEIFEIFFVEILWTWFLCLINVLHTYFRSRVLFVLENISDTGIWYLLLDCRLGFEPENLVGTRLRFLTTCVMYPPFSKVFNSVFRHLAIAMLDSNHTHLL